MDKIRVKNIKIFAYHGVIQEEQNLGQNFEIDVVLGIRKNQAGISDDLSKTVDYSKVYNLVVDIFTKKTYKLIETLAEKISQKLLSFDNVENVKIKIRKPSVPINGQLDFVEIEINR